MQQEIWAIVQRYRTGGASAAGHDEERHRVLFYMHCFPDTEQER